MERGRIERDISMKRASSHFLLPFIIMSMLLPLDCLAAEQALQKWEYKVIRAGDFDGDAPIERLDQWQSFMEKEMNELGQHQWQLVSVDRANGLVMFFFKRPLK